MMYRENLNEMAKTLQEKHEFKDDSGKVLESCAEIFKANLGHEFAIFSDFIRVPRTEEETLTARKPVDKAIGYYNDEMRMLRLEQLEDMKAKDAVLSYLENQCVSGFEFGFDKKAGVWKCDPIETVELEAFEFVKFIFETEKDTILDCCRIFVDNLAANELGGETHIARKGLSAGYIELRTRKGWTLPKDAKASNKALAAQLTEICKMISVNVAPTMINADVKFVKSMVIDGKSEANKAGTFVTKNDSTIVKAIFRAMYTRHNGLAYEWQNKAGFDKSSPTAVKANEVMAENPKSEEFAPAKPAQKVGPTLGTPEA